MWFSCQKWIGNRGKIHESWHGSWCCFFLMVVYILVASLIFPFFLPTLSLSLSLLLSSSSLPFLPLRSRFVSKSYYFCCYCHSWRIIRNIALLTRVAPSQELDRRVRREGFRKSRGTRSKCHFTHSLFFLSFLELSLLPRSQSSLTQRESLPLCPTPCRPSSVHELYSIW